MGGGRAFPTTRWSMVLAARGEDSADAECALATLCELYWYPLYAFLRRRGDDREQALDLTQGFFEQLIARRTLGDLRPGSGRFRSFLLSSLKHFASHQRAHDSAQRRGGGRVVPFLDGESAECRYGSELQDDRTPERAYEKAWAATLLERVRDRLRQELESAGKGHLFAQLGAALGGTQPVRPQREVAAALGISEDAVKMTLMRLRRRYGRMLREEIAHTVRDPSEIDDELRHLLAIVRDD